MTVTALVLYLTGLVLVFGVPTYLAWRATGDTRFRRPDTRPFSVPWWGMFLFSLAWLLGLAAPVTALVTGAAAPPPWAGWSGLGLMVVGLLLSLTAQMGMGESWRIGVRGSERTGLITGGLFALVRNPFFSALVIALVGMVLAVPGVLSLAALLALVAGVQVQVRLIEEPYLSRTHGTDYRAYAARTGRFVPLLGRLPTAATEERL